MRPVAKSVNLSTILVGADIIRPVILEQNHFGEADISPAVQWKSEISGGRLIAAPTVFIKELSILQQAQ